MVDDTAGKKKKKEDVSAGSPSHWRAEPAVGTLPLSACREAPEDQRPGGVLSRPRIVPLHYVPLFPRAVISPNALVDKSVNTSPAVPPPPPGPPGHERTERVKL